MSCCCRYWLCYSTILDSVYCEPCWLFADRNATNFTTAWTTGKINDWQGLSKKIKKHEIAKIHVNACLVYNAWSSNKTIDVLLDDSMETWKQVLKRLIDVAMSMAICNIPFRGHRENIYDQSNKNQGNFLSIVQLLARYDPVLEAHLKNISNQRNHYLSKTIQNEMINLIADNIVGSILSDIQKAPFFSIILDTTQDISKIDQLSIIIRYITNENQNLKIRESFLGFIEMKGQSAHDFEKEILDFLKKHDLLLEKCRGQGYDGAANMSGNMV